jgi:fructose/tagatose bisphosphate aldolase
MIRCNWYFWTGKLSHSHDCHTVEEAFERLQRTGMDALVWPVGTVSGLYTWNAHDDRHTLEALRERMDAIRLSAQCSKVISFEVTK